MHTSHSLRKHPTHLFLGGFLCLFLVGCADFFNRTYRYGEEAPVGNFGIRLLHSEYAFRDDRVELKISLKITNKVAIKSSITKDSFILRVGKDRQVMHDTGFLETLGFRDHTFDANEDATYTIPFVISRDEFAQKLALVVGKSENPKKPLTLFSIKNSGTPSVQPPAGEWRKAQSPDWK